MESSESYFTANRDSWNKRTAVHKDSAFYDLEGFKKGKSSLNKIELSWKIMPGRFMIPAKMDIAVAAFEFAERQTDRPDSNCFAATVVEGKKGKFGNNRERVKSQ